MLKLIIAAVVLAVGGLWLESLLQLGIFPGGSMTYMIGVGAAVLCILAATMVSRQVIWLAGAVLLVGGAVLFWGLGHSDAIYGVVAGVGVVAGSLALLLFAGYASGAPAPSRR